MSFSGVGENVRIAEWVPLLCTWSIWMKHHLGRCSLDYRSAECWENGVYGSANVRVHFYVFIHVCMCLCTCVSGVMLFYLCSTTSCLPLAFTQTHTHIHLLPSGQTTLIAEVWNRESVDCREQRWNEIGAKGWRRRKWENEGILKSDGEEDKWTRRRRKWGREKAKAKEWESDIKHKGANWANSPAHSFLSCIFPFFTSSTAFRYPSLSLICFLSSYSPN